MRFEYLADCPAHLTELARLHFDEWSHLRPDETLDDRIVRLRYLCGRNSIPTVIVALEGEALCGSAMLVPHELDDRPDLAPWLDGVYVAPAHRSKGLGSALTRRIVEEAKSLGVSSLYLYTSDAESLYSRLGWVPIERRQHRGDLVTVMAYRLPPNNSPERSR